jgi:uncharacterized protein involved in exopolysaccharide biosynthesis
MQSTPGSPQETRTYAPQPDPDEIEIDLKKYVNMLASRWRVIVTSVLIAALLGGLFALVAPFPYEAVANVAIVRTSTQVEFDPRIKTVTQDEIAAAQAQTVDSRRATLVTLVQNTNIAQTVLDVLNREHPGLLTPAEQRLGALLELVKSESPGRSEIIAIKVQDRDPVKAALIANLWAREYERQVNQLYVGASESYVNNVSQEYTRAQTEAEKAQKDLEAFIATSIEDALKRKIDETGKVLDSLQDGRQSAVTLVISEQLRVNSSIIAAYLDAQSKNRTLAFEKEQQGRRELMGALLDAQNLGAVSTVREQVNANLESLKLLLNARVRTRQFLLDARSMRAAVEKGGDSAASSNAAALGILKTQIFALTVPMSDTLRIDVSTNASGTALAVDQIADLDGLISALEQRDEALTREIAALSEGLQTGNAYSLTLQTTLSTSNSLLTSIISDTYPALFDVGAVGELSENVPVTNPLTQAAQRRASELVRTQTGSIGLNGGNSEDPTILRYQDELRKAQAELEAQEARRKLLVTERDLRRDTADSLARKRQEVGLSATIAGTEVRLTGPAAEPTQRVMRRAIPTAAAALTGALIGLILALALSDSTRAEKLARKTGNTRLGRWVLNL